MEIRRKNRISIFYIFMTCFQLLKKFCKFPVPPPRNAGGGGAARRLSEHGAQRISRAAYGFVYFLFVYYQRRVEIYDVAEWTQNQAAFQRFFVNCVAEAFFAAERLFRFLVFDQLYRVYKPDVPYLSNVRMRSEGFVQQIVQIFCARRGFFYYFFLAQYLLHGEHRGAA